jgi:hypothetical protein
MTVQISIEQLVASIVREVVSELVRRGITVTGGAPHAPGTIGTGRSHDVPAPTTAGRGSPAQAAPTAALSPNAGTMEIDMSGYRTPILTEDYLIRLAPSVSTLIVPCSTVLTPGARDLIRKKKLSIVRKAQSH